MVTFSFNVYKRFLFLSRFHVLNFFKILSLNIFTSMLKEVRDAKIGLSEGRLGLKLSRSIWKIINCIPSLE